MQIVFLECIEEKVGKWNVSIFRLMLDIFSKVLQEIDEFRKEMVSLHTNKKEVEFRNSLGA